MQKRQELLSAEKTLKEGSNDVEPQRIEAVVPRDDPGVPVFDNSQHNDKLELHGALESSIDDYFDNDIQDQYQIVWECQLPYSIHAVSFLDNENERLLVITRRSTHIFSRKNQHSKNLTTAKTDCVLENLPSKSEAEELVREKASLVRKRLLSLL